MGCGCEDNTDGKFIYPIEGKYVLLNERLVEYGKEICGPQIMEKFNRTHMWVFTFYCEEEINCPECVNKFAAMTNWFTKYNFLEDRLKNIKWVTDDQINNNLILRDLHIKLTPVHIFTDGNGKIIDILYGFPDESWLEKHILPLMRMDTI